jgi:hypothetical protein
MSEGTVAIRNNLIDTVGKETLEGLHLATELSLQSSNRVRVKVKLT